MFEKLLQKRFMNFYNKKNLLHPSQFEFRSKMSHTDAITTITEVMRVKIYKQSSRQACFLDLRNTFDALDHEELL